jgi:microcompartment protein CcmL/EutN
MYNAIGLLETKGLIAAINGADAAIKAASVKVIKIEKIGSAYVTVIVRGDVAAVGAAMDAAREAASKYGQVISCSVIPRPHPEVEKSFGLEPKKETTK